MIWQLRNSAAHYGRETRHAKIDTLAAACLFCPVAAGAVLGAPAARADNKRLNDGVVANVYTVQHQAGCTNDVKINPQLQLAAQWHAADVLNNRNLDGDIGSDGSTAQDRAQAAGFLAEVARDRGDQSRRRDQRRRDSQPVVLQPRIFRDHVHLRQQPNRGVVGKQPGSHRRGGRVRAARSAVSDTPTGGTGGTVSPVALQENVPIDPSPDYDASDEVEYGIAWLPWILRGVYPPPAMPPH